MSEKSPPRDIRASYDEFEDVLVRYSSAPRDVESTLLIRRFQREALDTLAKLSDRLRSRLPGMAGRAAEDRMQEILERYARRHRQSLDMKSISDIPTIDKLISRASDVIAQLLSRDMLRLPYRIYPLRPAGADGISPGERAGLDELRTAAKYSILIDILVRRDVDPSDISVTEEALDHEQMRQVPYRIVHVRRPQGIRTVCVSDQIGERTYVYDGMVDLAAWSESEKNRPLAGMAVRGVTYDERYAEKLERVVFGEWGESVSDTEEGGMPISSDTPLRTLILYQSQILEARESLAEAGIACEDGIWYFGDAQGVKEWPRIG